MIARTLTSPPTGEKNPTQSESAARAALESLAQAAFTDAEWQRVRATLLQLLSLLRRWRRKADMIRESSTGSNVVTIREATIRESPIDKAA